VSKFSSKKPKGDNWGIEQAIAEMAEVVRGGQHSPIIPIIAMVDSDTGGSEAVVALRRVEAITKDNLPKALQMVMAQVAERRGEGTMLPFDEAEILRQAFGDFTGQTAGEALQDDEERAIDEQLDDTGRLRRHMIAVHDFDPNVMLDEENTTPADLNRAHDAEHEKDPADRAWPDHEADDLVWRRGDLADLLGDAEEPATTLYEVDGAITDNPDPNATLTDPDQPQTPEEAEDQVPLFRSEADADDEPDEE
jgi:hypothetical protein